MTPLRSLPPDFDLYIRTDQALTLLLVPGDGREPGFATTVSGKDTLLSARRAGDRLMLAWTGRYRTDIFALSDQDIAKHYAIDRTLAGSCTSCGRPRPCYVHDGPPLTERALKARKSQGAAR